MFGEAELPLGGRCESVAAFGEADVGRCLDRLVVDDEPGRGCIYRSFCVHGHTIASIRSTE